MTPVFHHVGDQCLFVEFGNAVDPALNRLVLAFTRRLTALRPSFVTDIVPSWTGVGIYYRADVVQATAAAPAFEVVREQVMRLLASPLDTTECQRNEVEIPVCYGGQYGPDLTEVAARCALSEEQVIAMHTETTGRAFMIGFAPGHPFIGLWDEKLAIPRRTSPRTHIPAGTVAIANRQTNIYPFELPGGWNMIGRTPRKVFDPARTQPCLINPGDYVRFVSISEEQFQALYQQEHAR